MPILMNYRPLGGFFIPILPCAGRKKERTAGDATPVNKA